MLRTQRRQPPPICCSGNGRGCRPAPTWPNCRSPGFAGWHRGAPRQDRQAHRDRASLHAGGAGGAYDRSLMDRRGEACPRPRRPTRRLVFRTRARTSLAPTIPFTKDLSYTRAGDGEARRSLYKRTVRQGETRVRVQASMVMRGACTRPRLRPMSSTDTKAFGRLAHQFKRKNASSSTSVWLRVVSLTGVDAFSMTPMSDSHSQAMITCSMS